MPNKSKSKNNSNTFPKLNVTHAQQSAGTANVASNSGWLFNTQQQQYCDTNASFLNATTQIATKATTSSYLVIPRQHCISHNAINNNSKFASLSNTLSRHFQSQQRQQQTDTTHHHHRRQHEVKARNFAALHLNRILLNCVQLNVFLVFLLCTLNVSFVIVPSVSAVVVNNTSEWIVGDAVNALNGGVTNQLDYEESDSGTSDAAKHYTHTWAVYIPNGDNNGIADQVAKDHGFVNMGKVRT